MARTLIVLLGLGLVAAGRNAEPLFFHLQDSHDQSGKRELVFTYPSADSSITHGMYLVYDQKQQPFFFWSPIQTPVCIDGICKPVEIELYWDLTGKYAGYGLAPESPLTKFDHELFTNQDYEKLDVLLQDKHSKVGRRTLDELLTSNQDDVKKITYDGVEVDAVSGATVKAIRDAVVEGALYSCYTLWNLIYGVSASEIRTFISSEKQVGLIPTLLKSPYSNYQFEALKLMSQEQLLDQLALLPQVFLQVKPVARHYLLKKAPDTIWQDPGFSNTLGTNFADLDLGTRTLVIDNLDKTVDGTALLLAKQVSSMSQNQVKGYLSFLHSIAADNRQPYREALATQPEDETHAFGYLVARFLEDY